eukprot:TRINITY_DN35501_c0_g1_i1.p1 TRINITY_DN35501_c0_g1~~TRINITY_DN35501_c0_g1_i1.p1  ORF type:complete len:835 (+),score=320.73 TRINITY_DN35501_c0_g1_i1:60-2507(+)
MPDDEAHTAAHAAAERIGKKYQMNDAGRRELRRLIVSMSNSDISADGLLGESGSPPASSSSEDPSTLTESAVCESSVTDDWDAPPQRRPRRGASAEAQAELALAHQHAMHQARQRQEEEKRQRLELTARLEQAVQVGHSLREQNSQLRQEREAREMAHSIRERELAHQAEVTQERLDSVIRQLSALDEGGRGAVRALRDSLAEQLFVGDEQARRLRAKPPEALEMADWVRLRVHDEQQEARRQNDEFSAQVDLLRLDKKEAVEAKQRAVAEMEQAARDRASAMESAQRFDERCQALELEMSRVAKRSEDDRIKILQADRVLEERDQLRQQLTTLRADHDQATRRAAVLAEELQTVQAKATEGMSKVWEAATQRQAHEQVVAILKKREQELEAEKTRCQQRAEDLQAQLDQQSERFRKDLSAARQEHDERGAAELARVQEQAARDIQGIRERCDAVKSREMAQLTSERDRAQQEAQQLRLRLEEAESSIRHERAEWRRVDDAAKVEAADLRSTNRVTKHELHRLEVLRGEHTRAIEELQLQVECETRKLATLKDEFYDQQRLHGEDRAQMQAVLAARTEKLKVYEELEADCDEAIEKTAVTVEPGEEHRAAASLAQVPSAPQRRIQQSLLLARKAIRLEKDLAGMQEALKEKTVALTRAERELDRVKGVLGNQQQPYQYFVDSLARKDAEVERLSGDLDLARGDVRDAQGEQRVLEQHVAQLQGRLSASQTELVRLQAKHREFRVYLQQLKLVPSERAGAVHASPQRRRRRKKEVSAEPLVDLLPQDLKLPQGGVEEADERPQPDAAPDGLIVISS